MVTILAPPLYLRDPQCLETETRVLGCDERGIVVSDALVFPGCEECPADFAEIEHAGRWLPILAAHLRPSGQHLAILDVVCADETVRVRVDRRRRNAVGRLHSAMHAAEGLLQEHFPEVAVLSAWIANDTARIDLEAAKPEALPSTMFEVWLNERLQRDLAISSTLLSPDEYANLKGDEAPARLPRSGLDRLLRVVEIEGLHRQICDGPHVSFTGECGPIQAKIGHRVGRLARLELTLAPQRTNSWPNISSHSCHR